MGLGFLTLLKVFKRPILDYCMSISVDELSERLGIKEIHLADLPKGRGIGPREGRIFDGFALPSHRIIAPIISERLNGTKSVLEVGFGTGFRLMHYALNNPSTEFTAIDKDSEVFEQAQKRIEELGIKNVRLKKQDMFDLKIDEWKHACVLAIDCLPREIPVKWRGKVCSYEQMVYGSHLLFGSLVDFSQKPSFSASVFYGAWTEQHNAVYYELGRKVGLTRLETVPFNYRANGRNTSGEVVIASP